MLQLSIIRQKLSHFPYLIGAPVPDGVDRESEEHPRPGQVGGGTPGIGNLL